ncbi:hypothetical protein NBT05_13945 [Aquimarina sp. ERC-38]|uniref:hypothetical protein n=1 Tax=Aquimarina sp. ERC-38 TaxID=2949996 RepID=UPI002245AF42|nr:hypothetical protein [Aquimarina sp. ERC-38]UZO80044.1 hypothetical protein NBT05_13945 [Aquimarina sp. ERC-38]
MSQKYLLILLVCISTSLFAQKPILTEAFDFTIGEKYKKIKNLQSYYFSQGNYLASFKKGRDQMTIQRFSLEEMKEDYKKRQVIEDKGDFQTIMKLGSRALLFYANKDKAFAQGISITGKVADKSKVLVDDSENITEDFGFKSTFGFDAGGRIHKFGFKKSFNETKLLILYRIKTPNDEPDKIGIKVFDPSLELLWERKIALPHASDKLIPEDFSIDDEGTFYMSASLFTDTTKDKNKEENLYKTEVYTLQQDAENFSTTTLGLTNKVVSNAVFGLNKTGAVALTGFYASGSSPTIASGIFSASILKEGSIRELIQTDFPKDKVNLFATQRETRINEGTQSKKDKTEFENLKVNKIFYNANGSFTVLGEQRYVESFTTSSSSGSRTTYTYYYNHGIAAKSSASGTMDWLELLPKEQMGVRGKASMSYYPVELNNKYYLFHVDHFTNLKKSFDEKPDRYLDGKKDFLYLVSYTIDAITGKVEKEPVLTGRDVRNSRLDNLQISKVAATSNNELYYELNDGSKNNLLLKLTPSN